MRPLNLVVKYFIETSFEFSNKFEKQANMKNSHELSVHARRGSRNFSLEKGKSGSTRLLKTSRRNHLKFRKGRLAGIAWQLLLEHSQSFTKPVEYLNV